MNLLIENIRTLRQL